MLEWEWLNWLPKELQVLFLAGMPFIELRGAIPYASLIGVEFKEALLLGVAGNLIPIVPVLYFFQPIMQFLNRYKRYENWVRRAQENALSKSEAVQKYGAFLGLALFVAIPVPGTGAYSACLVALFFKIPVMIAFLAIATGTIVSGLLFTVLSQSIVNFFI